MNVFNLIINFYFLIAIVQMNTVDTHLTVTPEFETFDLARFERIKLGSKRLNGMETLDNGTTVLMQKINAGSSYAEVPVNSYFYLNKIYYTDGKIKAKGFSFVYEGFPKGLWYYFDEQGNLTDSIDHDKPFLFTFEQVLKFCEKEGLIFMKTPIDTQRYRPLRPKITREHNLVSGECWWEIEWYKGIPIGTIERIRLDGATGKEISRTYMTFKPE